MDEPFSALDPLTTENLIEEMKKIHSKCPVTILFVTHDFREARILADRIGVIEEGELKKIVEKEIMKISLERKQMSQKIFYT
jgi:molybdate transport system ATP-binding protein